MDNDTILTEQLSRMIANLDAWITRRAAELAEEHIKAADEDCAQRVAAAEWQVQRRDDVITELRRHLQVRGASIRTVPEGSGSRPSVVPATASKTTASLPKRQD